MNVLKRIIKHAKRDGRTMKEGFEQASYRLERTYGAVYAFWSSNVDADFKQYVKKISKDQPIVDDYETAIEEAFGRAASSYTEDDLPFDEPHPEQYHPTDAMNAIHDSVADTRYNLPRLPPNASEADVEDVIDRTPIYDLTRDAILGAQRRQVAYGLDKYPEPLNADTWTIIETIDHIISETADKLHYLTMLKIKLQQGTEENT